MKRGVFILLVSIFLIEIACSNRKQSRVTEFNYGGYDDTVFALLRGRIYERTTKGSLIELKGVQIKAEQNNKTVVSNLHGDFAIGLEKGIFDLVVTKQGCQSLKISNFVSEPDQLSDITIVLEKGEGVSNFNVPDHK